MSKLYWFSPLALSGGVAVATLAITPLVAEPLGGQVVGGSATIQGAGTGNLTINQSTSRAIINWQSFNIGPNETARFIQPSAAAIALNRVTGDRNPSQILGSITANGQVFLVNPEGFVFGAGARINTAGFLATTHDIRNSDFMAGKYNFDIPGNPSASIINRGTITVTDTGMAALVAPGVRNEGVITARLGTVALASANGFTLDFYGDGLIKFQASDAIAGQVVDAATGKPMKTLVENRGTLSANGGTVAMTAVTARAVVDNVINNSGVIEARSAGMQNGRIVLGAQTAATKVGGAPKQQVAVSGKLDVSGNGRGEKGGSVQITGEDIALTGTTIIATGDTGGGRVLIGGDTGGGSPSTTAQKLAAAALEATAVATATTVTVDAATRIDASATTTGNGGKVVVWADGSTSFSGSIAAHGSTTNGDGGFAEVSGRETLAFSGTVNLGATNGLPGTLLLDPKDVTIGTTGTWIVTPAAIQAALATSNVEVNTSAAGSDAGDITVAQSVAWSNANTLTLSANRNIIVNTGVTISNTGAGSLALRSDNTGSGSGTVTFNGTGKVDFSGGTGLVSIFYNPSSYTSPTNFAPFVTGGQLTSYMLVNNVTNLQSVQQNLSGAYALGKDIDATATAGWNAGSGFVPIGTSSSFSGAFDGQNHTIDGLFINSNLTPLGLFGNVSASGQIRNLNLTNVNITGNTSYFPGTGYIGGLVGNNAGLVTNSSSTGLVRGTGFDIVGGLVGNNQGTISASQTAGTVSCFNIGNCGGVAGANTGTVTRSYSSATVTGDGGIDAGGLVGWNGGQITQSSATGNVSDQGSGNNRLGGLVGFNTGTIGQSYATGSVTLSVRAGGGLVGENTGTITESYSTGLVSGGSIIGGFLGTVGSTVTSSIINSYWDTQTSGQATSAAGVGQTTSQLTSGLPSGFSASVWGSTGTVNGGYPSHLWRTATPPAIIALLTGGFGTPPTTLSYVASPVTVTYGSPIPVLAGTVIGFLPGDTLATSTIGMLAFNTTATQSSNVGSYAVTGSGLSPIGNYVFAQASINATAFTITPALLTIAVNNASRTVGQSNPPFTATYTGLVLSQTPSVVSGLSFAPTANTASPPGNYAITASGATAPNYTIQYTNGVLVITSAGTQITAPAAIMPTAFSLYSVVQDQSAQGNVNRSTIIDTRTAGSTQLVVRPDKRSEKAWQDALDSDEVKQLTAVLTLKLEVYIAANATGGGPAAGAVALLVTSSILNAKKAWEGSSEFRQGQYWMASVKIGQALLGEFVAIVGTASLGLGPLALDVAKLATAMSTVYIYSYATYQP